jgi:hypothetical protein
MEFNKASMLRNLRAKNFINTKGRYLKDTIEQDIEMLNNIDYAGRWIDPTFDNDYRMCFIVDKVNICDITLIDLNQVPGFQDQWFLRAIDCLMHDARYIVNLRKSIEVFDSIKQIFKVTLFDTLRGCYASCLVDARVAVNNKNEVISSRPTISNNVSVALLEKGLAKMCNIKCKKNKTYFKTLKNGRISEGINFFIANGNSFSISPRRLKTKGSDVEKKEFSIFLKTLYDSGSIMFLNLCNAEQNQILAHIAKIVSHNNLVYFAINTSRYNLNNLRASCSNEAFVKNALSLPENYLIFNEADMFNLAKQIEVFEPYTSKIIPTIIQNIKKVETYTLPNQKCIICG